ncbi:auxin-induced protein 6B-like [Curcuma longa]|uniref:auxin-induced protein 6B-like n=1 Tax=Curcuma longa TaxID=136217 RepID=UPI003D9ED566
MGKCNKIRGIVRLRQILQRWRQRASAAAAASSSLPPDVPAGHVALCVGGSARRFVVRTSHLNHPVFRQLLLRTEEEYGFASGRPGPVSLPGVDEAVFERLLLLISSPRTQNCSLEDFEAMLSPAGSDLRRCAGESRPLLHSRRRADEPVW